MHPGPEPLPATAFPLHAFRGLDAVLTKVRARGPFARDRVLAGWLAAGSVLVLVPVLGPFSGQLGLVFAPRERAAVLVLVAVQALLLVLRRVRPTACLLAVAVLQVGLGAILPVDAGIRLAAPVVAA